MLLFARSVVKVAVLACLLAQIALLAWVGAWVGVLVALLASDAALRAWLDLHEVAVKRGVVFVLGVHNAARDVAQRSARGSAEDVEEEEIARFEPAKDALEGVEGGVAQDVEGAEGVVEGAAKDAGGGVALGVALCTQEGDAATCGSVLEDARAAGVVPDTALSGPAQREARTARRVACAEQGARVVA